MPSTPDIYVPCEDCEKVADLVRYRLRHRSISWCSTEREERFREVLCEVRHHLYLGEWRYWNDLRKETAVAVAQRMAAAILFARPVLAR